MLRDAERSLFLAVSMYRKALGLMTPAAASWAHVTLYYSAFFASKGLLGIFGGWLGKKRLVEVVARTPGNQELILRRKGAGISNYSGSHEQFWDVFYSSVTKLTPWINPSFRPALAPPEGSVLWQTQTRNLLNYDSFNAVELSVDFQTAFKSAAFPGCLPGRLSTQYSTTEGLLSVFADFASRFGLTTDALDHLTPAGSRKDKVKALIFREHAPGLLRKTIWRKLVI
jgi:hypothetical protein